MNTDTSSFTEVIKVTYNSKNGTIDFSRNDPPLPCSEGAFLIQTLDSVLEIQPDLNPEPKSKNRSLNVSNSAVLLDSNLSMCAIETGAQLGCTPGNILGKYWVSCDYATKISDNLGSIYGGYAGMGGMVLHALRQSNITFGETMAVLGLGISGNLLAQTAMAAGYRVFGIDSSEFRNHIALESGIEAVININNTDWLDDFRQQLMHNRIDAIFLCAHADKVLEKISGLMQENCVIIDAFKHRHHIFGMHNARKASTPGSIKLDTTNHIVRQYHPFSFERWSQQRDLEYFATLLDSGKISTTGFQMDKINLNNIKIPAFEQFDNTIDSFGIHVISGNF